MSSSARCSRPTSTAASRGNSAARRRVPLPTAAKEPKRRFFGPLWRLVPSGGQNLSGSHSSFRATGPWPCKISTRRSHQVRLACTMLFGPVMDDGPMSSSARCSETSPYGCLHQARFPGPACRASPKLPSQRQRRGSRGNRLYHPRRMRGTAHRKVSPVTGSGGRRLECWHSWEPAPGDLKVNCPKGAREGGLGHWFFPSLERTQNRGFHRPALPAPRQSSTKISQYLVWCFSIQNKILCNIRRLPPCIWCSGVL